MKPFENRVGFRFLIALATGEEAVERASQSTMILIEEDCGGTCCRGVCEFHQCGGGTLRLVRPITGFHRQVLVNAPSTMTPGQRSNVTVTLTAGGNETLHDVRVALQLPDGWSVRGGGQKVLGRVKPRRAVAVTFTVTPPSWAPSTNSVVHATADLGPDAQREAGATVTVS